MFMLLGYTMYYFSNLLGLAVLGYGIYWVMAYTGQRQVLVVLPTGNAREYLRMFLPIACWFKLLDILFLVYRQSRHDIFLIDWERAKSDPQAESSSTDLASNVR